MKQTERLYLTAEGQAQLILATIKRLDWERECIHETLDSIEQFRAENGLYATTVVYEELEIEESELSKELAFHEERYRKLTGAYSNGIPF